MRARDNFPFAETVTWICPECGAGLQCTPRRALTRKFCGRACLYAAQRRARAAGELTLPPGHKTEEGRRKSLQNLALGKEGTLARWALVAHVWYTCAACGGDFASRATLPPRYCSDACRARAISKEQRYTVEKSCCICAQPYRTNRYKPGRTCSRRCARLLALQEKQQCT